MGQNKLKFKNDTTLFVIFKLNKLNKRWDLFSRHINKLKKSNLQQEDRSTH